MGRQKESRNKRNHKENKEKQVVKVKVVKKDKSKILKERLRKVLATTALDLDLTLGEIEKALLELFEEEHSLNE